MRSTHPEDQRGPRPAWNGVGLGLVALAVVLFVLFAPAQPAQEDPPSPPTISLDDLEAMLTDSVDERPAEVQVQTPDGPVTVVIPTTTPRATTSLPATTTTRPPATTTTSTTTTTVPRTPRDPLQVGADIIDDLTATTLPEGAEDGR